MANLKFKKKKKTRRSRKTKGKALGRVFSPAKSITNGMPDTIVLKMRYCESVALAPTLGVISSAEYGCNNIYDPRTAAGGHQPMGFDQYVQNYYNYGLVLGSRMTVKFMPQSTSTSIPIACGIYAYDKVNSSLAVQGYTTWVQFKESGAKVSIINTDKSFATVKSFFSMKKHVGVIPEGSIDYMNKLSAGPTLGQWTYYIWAQAYDLTSTTAGVLCDVTIDYVVRWSDRLPLPGS